MTESGTYKIIIYFIAALLLLSACKTKKNIVQTTPPDGHCKIDFKNAKTLTRHLKDNQFNYTWLMAKFDVTVNIQNKSTDFNVVMKCRKDSVIWMSIIDPLIGAVEGARVILTRDSVKFMDRINKVFFVGGYDTIKKMIRVDDLDFEMVQSLLMGNSVEFYEEDEKVKPGMDKTECRYLLGTLRKKKLRKILENGVQLKDPAQNIWLDPITFKITRLFFMDFNTNRSFDAYYNEYRLTEDSTLFPNKIQFDIKAEKTLNIAVKYNKLTLNKEQTFPFSIPSTYENIKKK